MLQPARELKPRWQHQPGKARATPDRAGERERAGSDRALVCARCGRDVTSIADATEVDGLHEYTQVNPGGFIWNFRCFSRAAGCRPIGAPSSEFSWFAGHVWRIAHCAACDFHLGWEFASAERGFWGLITERVVEAAQT